MDVASHGTCCPLFSNRSTTRTQRCNRPTKASALASRLFANWSNSTGVTSVRSVREKAKVRPLPSRFRGSTRLAAASINLADGEQRCQARRNDWRSARRVDVNDDGLQRGRVEGHLRRASSSRVVHYFTVQRGGASGFTRVAAVAAHASGSLDGRMSALEEGICSTSS